MNFSVLGMSCQLMLSDVVPTLDYREGICSMGLPCHLVGPPFYVCSLFVKTMACLPQSIVRYWNKVNKICKKPVSEDYWLPNLLSVFSHLLLPPCLILKVGISLGCKVSSIEFVSRISLLHKVNLFHPHRTSHGDEGLHQVDSQCIPKDNSFKAWNQSKPRAIL